MMVKGYRDGTYYYMKIRTYKDLLLFTEMVDWYVYIY